MTLREKIKKIIKGSEYADEINAILERLEIYGTWENMQNASRDGHLLGGKIDVFSLIYYLNQNEAKAYVVEKPKRRTSKKVKELGE